MYRIKNWNKFQHYKDRKPPWIKLHLALLHEVDYLSLTDKGKITLIHCWMAAGEVWKPDKETEPLLPSSGKLLKSLLKLEGNLRINEVKLSGYLIPVPNDYNNLLDNYASNKLAECYTETETEVEKDINNAQKDSKKHKTNSQYSKEFLEFWEAYPLKKDKARAFKAWKSSLSRRPTTQELIEIINKQIKWAEFMEFTPHPTTWLNGDRWEDEPKQKTSGRHPFRDLD